MVKLSDKVDEVWQSEDPRRTAAARVVKSASRSDKLKLIAIDIAILIGRIPHSVEIRNESAERIEVEPKQWSLAWTDKKGNLQENGDLDPSRVRVASLERSFFPASR